MVPGVRPAGHKLRARQALLLHHTREQGAGAGAQALHVLIPAQENLGEDRPCVPLCAPLPPPCLPRALHVFTLLVLASFSQPSEPLLAC